MNITQTNQSYPFGLKWVSFSGGCTSSDSGIHENILVTKLFANIFYENNVLLKLMNYTHKGLSDVCSICKHADCCDRM